MESSNNFISGGATILGLKLLATTLSIGIALTVYCVMDFVISYHIVIKIIVYPHR